MSWLEEMAINVVMGLLHQFIKNPAKAASLRTLLLGLASDIFTSYGIIPPTYT